MGRFKSISSPRCISTSRESCASFPVEGVGTMREDGGEMEPGESTVGAFDDDGRLAFLCPDPLDPFESCT